MIEAYFSTFIDLIWKNFGDVGETAGDGMTGVFQESGAEKISRLLSKVKS